MLNKLAQLQHSSFHAMILCRAVIVRGIQYDGTRVLSKTQLIMINQSNAGCFDPKVFVNCVQVYSVCKICSKNWIIQIHKDTLKQAHTILVLVLPRLGYMDPINGVSQQVATRPVAPLTVETPALSPQSHGSLSAVAALIYMGLKDP